MYKVTVLYNLAPDRDEQAFLEWRTNIHQKSNAKRPGVLQTDFYVAENTPLGPPLFRYITEVYYPDLEAVYKDFLAPGNQARIAGDVQEQGLMNFTCIVSREVARTEN